METRRSGGKVVHEHIASFGALTFQPILEERAAFWKRVNERLARLSNRVPADELSRILDALGAQIPPLTADEEREVQDENVEKKASEYRKWTRDAMRLAHAVGTFQEEDQDGILKGMSEFSTKAPERAQATFVTRLTRWIESQPPESFVDGEETEP